MVLEESPAEPWDDSYHLTSRCGFQPSLDQHFTLSQGALSACAVHDQEKPFAPPWSPMGALQADSCCLLVAIGSLHSWSLSFTLTCSKWFLYRLTFSEPSWRGFLKLSPILYI